MTSNAAAYEILERLISFPTVSDRSNRDLVTWVSQYLKGHGIKSHLEIDRTETKAGLFAQIGPDRPAGVVLSAHSDVVPVKGQNWRTDPWTLRVKDGRLIGRGACDMKGFLASVLAVVPRMVKADLAVPIQLAFSRDEEIGCLGGPPLIDRMREELPPAAVAIIGEPTMLKVVSGHKGSLGHRVTVTGHEVHSAILHKGVSAIHTAARLIDWGTRRNESVSSIPPMGHAALFDPPWSSFHVGMIGGGTALNTTAGSCSFCSDFRVVPGDDADAINREYRGVAAELEAKNRRVHPGSRISLTEYFRVPPLEPEPGGKALGLAAEIAQVSDEVRVVSYGTEAGQFQERGYSAVVCGPGDIAQAHQANEFISTSQFESSFRFVDRLVDRLSRP